METNRTSLHRTQGDSVLACRSAGAGLVVDPPSDGRLVVRGSAEGGGWIRVLHARTLTLLALAPLLPEGRGVRTDGTRNSYGGDFGCVIMCPGSRRFNHE